MKRRDFLKYSGGLSAQLLLGGTLVNAINAGRAEAQTGLPLQSLTAMLDPEQALVVLPNSADFAKYNLSFSKRKQLAPKIRVVANHPQAVQNAVTWATANGITFATRCGGHSYEGFSQSNSMVIDVRGLDQIKVDSTNNSLVVGSGLALGQIYKALDPYGLAIPAGSCFPVGVSGHTLGGGFGLLGRKLGLACDAVESIQLVDASGKLRTVSANEEPNLFWALRGGGNGSFGIVTELEFRASPIGQVAVFGVSWQESVAQAIPLIQTWQSWLRELPDDITCTLHLTKAQRGLINVHVAGQTTGSETSLLNELQHLQNETYAAHLRSSRTLPFIEAAGHFNGPEIPYESVYMKAKSDYVSAPMSDQGIKTLLLGLLAAPGEIAVMADSYGGAINRIPRDQTAFVHRGSTLYSFQYFMQWENAASSAQNIAMMQTLYQQMRPFVSGEAYVNYCDLDLPDFATAYWAENLPRLKKLKALYDPNNLFHHAQSVPRS